MKTVSLVVGVGLMAVLLGLFYNSLSEQQQHQLLQNLGVERIEYQKLVWVKNETLNRGLPSSIQVFQSSSSITEGIPQFSAYAIIDLSDPSIVYSIEEPPTEGVVWTPTQYAQNSKQKAYVVLNGGYFNMQTNVSQTLVQIDGVLKSPNIINQGANQHPTIGTFAYWKNHTMEALWTYNPNSSFTWAYQQPSKDPSKVPDSSYPTHGFSLNAYQAISAGPLLLKNKTFYAGTWEKFGPSIQSQRQPRSAVCKTENGSLVLFVGDGRSSTSAGLYLNETAAILEQIGCTDAINLDGGGSSCLLINSIEANQPSGGRQRPVTNALLIKASN